MLQVSCAVRAVDLATVMVNLMCFRNVRECSLAFPQSSLCRADKIAAVKVS